MYFFTWYRLVPSIEAIFTRFIIPHNGHMISRSHDTRTENTFHESTFLYFILLTSKWRDQLWFDIFINQHWLAKLYIFQKFVFVTAIRVFALIWSPWTVIAFFHFIPLFIQMSLPALFPVQYRSCPILHQSLSRFPRVPAWEEGPQNQTVFVMMRFWYRSKCL